VGAPPRRVTHWIPLTTTEAELARTLTNRVVLLALLAACSRPHHWQVEPSVGDEAHRSKLLQLAEPCAPPRHAGNVHLRLNASQSRVTLVFVSGTDSVPLETAECLLHQTKRWRPPAETDGQVDVVFRSVP